MYLLFYFFAALTALSRLFRALRRQNPMYPFVYNTNTTIYSNYYGRNVFIYMSTNEDYIETFFVIHKICKSSSCPLPLTAVESQSHTTFSKPLLNSHI